MHEHHCCPQALHLLKRKRRWLSRYSCPRRMHKSVCEFGTCNKLAVAVSFLQGQGECRAVVGTAVLPVARVTSSVRNLGAETRSVRGIPHSLTPAFRDVTARVRFPLLCSLALTSGAAFPVRTHPPESLRSIRKQ